ncbi:MAG: sigma-70 family RNA polymerase sigma factor [Pseudomonadota bacterium]|nr:sigma-70 family RNA polymerase sigma factor [Pseudomonadota bacterium]
MLRRAQCGDALAFRQLVERHQARVFGVALRLVGRHADAEDLAQEVFVQLHGFLDRIQGPEHLLHWLLRTVAHRSIDHLRREARQGRHLPLEVLEGAAEPSAPESPHDPVAAAELHRLLLRLQPDARVVMVLRYQEDLDPADIARVLDMPIATVKSHLRRSLDWLRTQCAGESHGY